MPSNSQHRPGANASLSPAAYAKEKLKKVENLEQQLSNLPAKKSDDQASKLRMRLCEILSDIILTDPHFSIRHDCIGRLWRNCFYSPIGVLRQRTAREKRKKGPNVVKYEKMLTHFLSEAITLYDYLMSQYHSKLLESDPRSLSLTPGSQSQSQSQSSITDSQPIATKDPTGVVPGLFRMYIHVGDLYRYQSNYTKSQTFYAKASRLSPGAGNPYNQLAVVAQLKDTAAPLNTVALYWYARSLLTTHEPFEISKANLARLFQSNRDWFHKQDLPDATSGSGGGGRELAKVQRTKASHHFLSQFVDLHFSFFQGIIPTTGITTNNINEDDKNPALNDEEVVGQMEAVLGPFTDLLRASAFGDALLCKMVAICAFSEVYNNSNSNATESRSGPTTTMLLARTFTLAIGACLAERVVAGLNKIKEQAENMEQSNGAGKAVPSVRLLLPLLLICEFVEHAPMIDDNQRMSTLAKSLCHKTQDSFWQNVAEVMNTLTSLLKGPLLSASGISNSSTGKSLTKLSLKEFSNLIGYSPFQPFLNDSMEASRKDGFASIKEAVDVLELNLSSTQDSSTQQSSTQDSTSAAGGGGGGSAQSAEESKIKVARFLAFGDRMADDNDTTTDVGRRFERTSDGGFGWKEGNMDCDAMDMDNDNPMMDTENNDTQPPSASTKGDVLVYSAPKGGGPPLLVPGMLLQMGIPDVVAPKIPAPPPAQRQAQPHVQAKPPGLPPPPPGFGSFGLAAAPAAPMVGIPAGMHPSYGASAQMGRGLNPAMSLGYGQGMPAGSYPPQQAAQGYQQPAMVGNSLHLFGGQEALQTGNPFAATSMMVPPSDNGMAYGGPSSMRVGNGIPNGGNAQGLFGGSGTAESSLLGSGLLDSLFADSTGKATKNPFAT